MYVASESNDIVNKIIIKRHGVTVTAAVTHMTDSATLQCARKDVDPVKTLDL